MFSAIGRMATSRYSFALLTVAAGIVIGYFVFFNLWPGKPKVAIIDIPFTVLSDDSAFVIDAFLDYARDRDDIKAVVIKLNSPGGGAAASEQLFLETVALRQKKPVVVVMNDIVASGGYMMALGANHTLTKPTTFVGSVGVILSFPGPLIPDQPDERVTSSGPFKLGGGSRRHFIELTEQVKQAFAQMVITERGEKLRLSSLELTEGRIYSGVEAVRLGLVDGVGGDTEAIEKTASLAGISNYDLVDVNTEVFRIFFQKIARQLEPLALLRADDPALADIRARRALGRVEDSPAPVDDPSGVEMLRRQFLPSGIAQIQEEAPPGFPMELNTPRIYYLYVGPTQ